MLIYGRNVLKEAINSGLKIKKVYLLDGLNDEKILNLINKKNLNLEYKSRSFLDKLVSGNHQGVVIDVSEYKYYKDEDINEDEKLIIVLDHLEDPQNFGAIIRTAECAGVKHIVIPNKRSVNVNATVMKTSAGALCNVDIVEVSNINNFIEKFKKKGYWFIGTDASGKNYSDVKYDGKIALVIGSEGSGLKYNTIKHCDEIVSLPLKGKINSLNASVACGIFIYEVIKYD